VEDQRDTIHVSQVSWLKTSWTALTVGILACLAIFAAASARRQKAIASKWQDKAVDIEVGLVKSGTLTAKAANTQAKLHNAKANEIRAKGVEARVKRIGEKDEDVASILDQFRTSG